MSGITSDDVNGSNNALMFPSEDESMDPYGEGSPSTDSRVLLNAYHLRRYRDNLGFNDSQLRAFQLALTKRFAIIQGPPGTGKTYVGLKIARVLLDTASLWEDEEERSPILMVSYTNHALDQFLEGLLPMPGENLCLLKMKIHFFSRRNCFLDKILEMFKVITNLRCSPREKILVRELVSRKPP